jgi:hypothetical protein
LVPIYILIKDLTFAKGIGYHKDSPEL